MATQLTGRRRRLIALESANVLATLGEGALVVFVPLIILDRTGNPGGAGLASAVAGVAGAFGAAVAGPAIDCLGAVVGAVGGDVLRALGLGVLAWLLATGEPSVPILTGLAATAALLAPVGNIARRVLLADLASGPEEMLRVTSIHDAAGAAALLAGPALAALALALAGPAAGLAAAAALGLAASIVLSTLGLTGHRRRQEPAEEGRWRSLLGGRAIGMVVGLASIEGFVVAPLPAVLLPALVREQQRPAATLGLLITFFAGGQIAGTIRAARRPRPTAEVVPAALRWSALGLGVFAAAALARLPASALMASGAATGYAIGPLWPALHAILLERAPPGMRARALGLVDTVNVALFPAGVAAAGLLAGATSAATAIAVCVGLITLQALWATLARGALA